jgi:tetratricopeptide (TPR) repeat protein
LAQADNSSPAPSSAITDVRTPSLLSDPASSATLAAANHAYENKQYEEAIADYENIILSKGYSSQLCYDLGNALFKAGQLGPAILQYERARYLDPWNHDIDNNLQLARKSGGLDPNSFTWWQVMIRVVPINAWLYMVEGGLLLYTITIMSSMWIVPRLSPAPFKIGRLIVRSVFFFGTPFFLFIVFFATLAYASNLRDLSQGVVVIKDPPLLISPTERAEKVDVLPEGDVVLVEQNTGSFIEVDARDRKFGWVRVTSVEPIVPHSF